MPPHVPARRLLSPALVALAATTALVAGTASAQATVPQKRSLFAAVVNPADFRSPLSYRGLGRFAACRARRPTPVSRRVRSWHRPKGQRRREGNPRPLRYAPSAAPSLSLLSAAPSCCERATTTRGVVSTKTVTLQSYPHEAVWLDGTVGVTGWVK